MEVALSYGVLVYIPVTFVGIFPELFRRFDKVITKVGNLGFHENLDYIHSPPV